MDITRIENIIASLSADKGYSPLIASEETLEASVKQYPTAWVQLPLVLYVEGREQGVICYKIVVALLDNYATHSFEDKRIRLAQMEQDMLSIMTELTLQEGVVEVESMTITPRVTHTTRHGDIAQICEGKVVCYF